MMSTASELTDDMDTTHTGMRDESWKFLSTFLENPAKYSVFSVEFNGVIRIFNFRQAITLKFKKTKISGKTSQKSPHL